jgi:pimeloyl-ACP methyl ester carboxylesterase
VETVGDPEGKPVFLLHGTPGSRYGPRPRGIVLHRLGIRLISYDRPGYSGSERFYGRNVASAADDVVAIANALGIGQFSVIGRSGGGPHALACAALLGQRVTCAAALSSLAPYNAEGLGWNVGMSDSNVQAYHDAGTNLAALVAKLDDQAGQVRTDPESLLRMLWPELKGDDKKVVGDIALRRIIAETHAAALSDTASGWIDDVVALRRPWGFDVSAIKVPVLLWHGTEDVFSPVGHTYWLEKRIKTAETMIQAGAAHFGAVEILPKILAWVAAKVNLGTSAELASV